MEWLILSLLRLRQIFIKKNLLRNFPVVRAVRQMTDRPYCSYTCTTCFKISHVIKRKRRTAVWWEVWTRKYAINVWIFRLWLCICKEATQIFQNSCFFPKQWNKVMSMFYFMQLSLMWKKSFVANIL